jgi:O-acetyl-ADP-ribose deacetylase (regulator of RNase III)
MTEIKIKQTLLRLVQGDITTQTVDGIVNAANNSLLGGGGVDGAIHRAGGPDILIECRRIRQNRYPAGLPTGQAVSTSGGRLPARRVIHTVGPVWHGGGAGEAELLADCYRNSLQVAVEDGLRTVAFPSISTGIYGYPVTQAAEVALSAIKAFIEAQPDKLEEVRMVLFSTYDLESYRVTLEKLS